MTRPSWADQNLPKQPKGLFLCISAKKKKTTSTKVQVLPLPTTHIPSPPSLTYQYFQVIATKIQLF